MLPRKTSRGRIIGSRSRGGWRSRRRGQPPIFYWQCVVLWMLFLRGEVGIVPLIDQVSAGSLAERAGLLSGQEVVSIDDTPTPTLAALNFALLERLGDSGTLRLSASYPWGQRRFIALRCPLSAGSREKSSPTLMAAHWVLPSKRPR